MLKSIAYFSRQAYLAKSLFATSYTTSTGTNPPAFFDSSAARYRQRSITNYFLTSEFKQNFNSSNGEGQCFSGANPVPTSVIGKLYLPTISSLNSSNELEEDDDLLRIDEGVKSVSKNNVNTVSKERKLKKVNRVRNGIKDRVRNGIKNQNISQNIIFTNQQQHLFITNTTQDDSCLPWNRSSHSQPKRYRRNSIASTDWKRESSYNKYNLIHIPLSVPSSNKKITYTSISNKNNSNLVQTNLNPSIVLKRNNQTSLTQLRSYTKAAAANIYDFPLELSFHKLNEFSIPFSILNSNFPAYSNIKVEKKIKNETHLQPISNPIVSEKIQEINEDDNISVKSELNSYSSLSTSPLSDSLHTLSTLESSVSENAYNDFPLQNINNQDNNNNNNSSSLLPNHKPKDSIPDLLSTAASPTLKPTDNKQLENNNTTSKEIYQNTEIILKNLYENKNYEGVFSAYKELIKSDVVFTNIAFRYVLDSIRFLQKKNLAFSSLEPIEVYNDMVKRDLTIDSHSYASVISILLDSHDANQKYMNKYFTGLNARYGNELIISIASLVDSLQDTSLIDNAFDIFKIGALKGLSFSESLYAQLIDFSCRELPSSEIVFILQQMEKYKLPLHVDSYVNLITRFGSSGDLDAALEILEDYKSNAKCLSELKEDAVYASVITAYFKSGNPEGGLDFFTKIIDSNTLSKDQFTLVYSAIIEGYIHVNELEEAWRCINFNNSSGLSVILTKDCLMKLLSATCQSNNYSLATEIYNYGSSFPDIFVSHTYALYDYLKLAIENDDLPKVLEILHRFDSNMIVLETHSFRHVLTYLLVKDPNQAYHLKSHPVLYLHANKSFDSNLAYGAALIGVTESLSKQGLLNQERLAIILSLTNLATELTPKPTDQEFAIFKDLLLVYSQDKELKFQFLFGNKDFIDKISHFMMSIIQCITRPSYAGETPINVVSSLLADILKNLISSHVSITEKAYSNFMISANLLNLPSSNQYLNKLANQRNGAMTSNKNKKINNSFNVKNSVGKMKNLENEKASEDIKFMIRTKSNPVEIMSKVSKYVESNTQLEGSTILGLFRYVCTLRGRYEFADSLADYARKVVPRDQWGYVYLGLVEGKARDDIDFAYYCFDSALGFGVQPLASTYAALILNQPNTKDAYTRVMQLHMEARSRNAISLYLYNATLTKLSKMRKIREAITITDEMANLGIVKNNVTYILMASCACRCGDVFTAEKVFSEVEKVYGNKIPVNLFNILLQYFVFTEPNKEKFFYYYNKMVNYLIPGEPYTFALLIKAHGYVKPYDIDAAKGVLEDMHKNGLKPNDTHYSAIIDSYGASGRLSDAIKFFLEVHRHTKSCNKQTFRSLIRVLCMNGKVSDLQPVLEIMKTDRVEMDSAMRNCMIRGYGIIGNVKKAYEYFEEQLLLERSAATYESMIRVYVSSGDCVRASGLLQRMQAEEYPQTIIHRLDELIKYYYTCKINPQQNILVDNIFGYNSNSQSVF